MKKIVYNIVLAGLASILIARAQTNTTDAQPVDNTNAASATPSAVRPAAASCHGVSRSWKTRRPATAAMGISTMPTARTGPAGA